MTGKYISFAVILSLVLLTVINPAAAEDIKGKMGIGYRYRYVAPDDDNFKANGNCHNINLTYGLTDNIALEGEAGHFRLKSTAASEVGVYSLHGGIQLRANAIKNLVPYLTGGAGFQVYDYNNVSGGDRKDKTISFSYKTGGGIEYFFNKNVAFNLEAVYIYGNTGGDASLDVYGWQYGGGVKYYF